MKASKKVVLFVVEGVSDQTSLALILSKLINNENVKFHIIGGDVTSDRFVTTENAIKRVNEQLEIFLDKNKFHVSDIKQIVHVTDVDGTYIPKTAIIETQGVDRLWYEEDKLLARNVYETIRRNERKAAVIDKLAMAGTIRKIPYMLLYFSCNLEHVLHNLKNVEGKKKDQLAEQFVNDFYGHEKDFITFIRNEHFAVKGDYVDTWEFIKQNLNSLKRFSNFHLIFDQKEEEYMENFGK